MKVTLVSGAAGGMDTHPSVFLSLSLSRAACTSTLKYGLQARRMQVGECAANGIENVEKNNNNSAHSR